jgi:glucose-1-phosphate cytidylyltransferase
MDERQWANADYRVSNYGKKLEILGEPVPEWSVSLIETGVWRNIGERLLAVKHLVKDEDYFLANYSDGLTDAPLDEMIAQFKESGKVAAFMAVHPPFNFHLAEISPEGNVDRFRSSKEVDLWINGGYFIFRKEIFNYINDGEELVLEPFNRLIEEGNLMPFRYEGFWRAMDTLRDRQVLEEMSERGDTPWRVNATRRVGAAI